MNKNVIYILLILTLFGCSNTHQKPFIVISKEFIFLGSISDETNRPNSNKCKYTYVDKYGSETTFHDYADIYNIGDTIQ